MMIAPTARDAALADARATYLAKIKGLEGRTLEMRLAALAGMGPDQIDPIVASFARQSLDVIRLQATAKANTDEIELLRRNPPRTLPPEEVRAKINALELANEHLAAKAIGVAERGHVQSINESVDLRQAAELTKAKGAALRSAAEARASEMVDNPEAVEALATAYRIKRP